MVVVLFCVKIYYFNSFQICQITFCRRLRRSFTDPSNTSAHSAEAVASAGRLQSNWNVDK
jgi:hypothetical protein